MTVETATYISQLNSAYPASGDVKSEGDNHLRLIKDVLQNTFPNLGAAAVTPTAAQLNTITLKGTIAGQTWTGTHDYTGATITVPTKSAGDNTTAAASTAYVTTAISAVTANSVDLTMTVETSASVTGVAGNKHILTNASATAVTTPASPSAGQRFAVVVANDRVDNTITYGSDKIMGLAESMTLTSAYAAVEFTYVNATLGWRIS